MKQLAVMIGFFVVVISLNSCTTISGGSTQEYAPRWVDYEEWGKLELGMDKKDVLAILGEPFMTMDGELNNGKSMEIFVYKFRVKLFVTKTSNHQVVTRGDRVSEEVVDSKEIKPEKFANTLIWGQIFDVMIEYNNSKLVRWTNPLLKQMREPVSEIVTKTNAIAR